jgi:hypothetical protein
MNFCVIAFSSTHIAMQVQRELEPFIKVLVMPTPREISTGCGISLRFDPQKLLLVQEILSKADIDHSLFQLYWVRQKADLYEINPIKGGE